MYLYALMSVDLTIIIFFYFILFISLPIKKMLIYLFYIDIFYYTWYILYNNIYNKFWNINNYIYLDRDVYLTTNYNLKYAGKLKNIQVNTFFFIKNNINIYILLYHNTEIKFNLDSIKSLHFDKKYYTNTIFDLVCKYNKNFKKLDIYIINYIKDFIL